MYNPLSAVWEVYDEIITEDLLEDRREYSVEDLQRSYSLTGPQALYLERLIQSNFDPKANNLYNWLGGQAVESTERAARNAAVAECIVEAVHDGLDGWEPHEKAVIELFLADLGVAAKIVYDTHKSK